jgi:hypothetical protein
MPPARKTFRGLPWPPSTSVDDRTTGVCGGPQDLSARLASSFELIWSGPGLGSHQARGIVSA